MRCFCCNKQVSGDDLDKATGRFYCAECWEWTALEILRSERLEKGYSEFDLDDPEKDKDYLEGLFQVPLEEVEYTDIEFDRDYE